jgi:hypothetical protein
VNPIKLETLKTKSTSSIEISLTIKEVPINIRCERDLLVIGFGVFAKTAPLLTRSRSGYTIKTVNVA